MEKIKQQLHSRVQNEMDPVDGGPPHSETTADSMLSFYQGIGREHIEIA